MLKQAAYLDYLIQHIGWTNIQVVQWYTIGGNNWEWSDLVQNNQITPAYEVWAE